MIKKRLYYVDWLRVFVIATLIPYHAALTYTGLGDIYIKKAITGNKVIPFIWVTMPLDNFFMTLLFFLSGIGTYYSFKYRKKDDYMKERVKKLLIPFLLGTVFLCPLQAYSKALYEGFTGNYFQFQKEFFSSKIVDYLGYAHLWFLLYLFVFSFLCYPLLKRLMHNKTRYKKLLDFISTKKNIYIPIIWIIIVETLLRPFFPGMQILIMDWANVIVYSSVYIFGFVYVSDNRLQDRLDRMMKQAMIIVIICLIALFGVYHYWIIEGGNSIVVTFLWAFLKGVYECFMIIMLLGLGRKYFNRESKVLRYLNKASFTYYVFHLLPVTYFTYITINTDLHAYSQFLITVILSYISIAILYAIMTIFRNK